MVILSLFDGMGCGMLAGILAGFHIEKYYAPEVDKYAQQVSNDNFPEIIRLGDVTKWRDWDIDWSEIDMVIAGSPCQGFSFAGKQLNFEDDRSKLFFEFVGILELVKMLNPKVEFLLENVKMKKEYQNVITGLLGVEPMEINSALVSAQNRKRLYWTNIEGVKQPRDKAILLKDIIETGVVDKDKSYCVDANYFRGGNPENYFKKSRRQLVFEKPHGFNKGGFTDREKFSTLRATTNTNYAILEGYLWRKLTPLECERLQTVPDRYTQCVSNTQRYKMLGNGWTVDVVAHIFRGSRHVTNLG